MEEECDETSHTRNSLLPLGLSRAEGEAEGEAAEEKVEVSDEITHKCNAMRLGFSPGPSSTALRCSEDALL